MIFLEHLSLLSYIFLIIFFMDRLNNNFIIEIVKVHKFSLINLASMIHYDSFSNFSIIFRILFI